MAVTRPNGIMSTQAAPGDFRIFCIRSNRIAKELRGVDCRCLTIGYLGKKDFEVPVQVGGMVGTGIRQSMVGRNMTREVSEARFTFKSMQD